MKTEYQKMYEYLTPKLVLGQLTTKEMAKILSVIQLLELRVNVLEKTAHVLYAESKREDLAQEAEREMKSERIINEGEE